MTAILSHLQCLILHVDHGVETPRTADISKFLSEMAKVTNCPLHRISSQWIASAQLLALISDLKRSVSGSNRTALLVCGSHLEDQVTVCSLEALLEGFEVHLLCDMISARDGKSKPVLLLKLFQAGVIPSTLRQLLFMWLTAESDEQVTEKLRKLIGSYDSTFGTRPA